MSEKVMGDLLTDTNQVMEKIDDMEKQFNVLAEQLEKAIVREDKAAEAEINRKLEALFVEKAALEKKVKHIVKQTKKLKNTGRSGSRWW